MDIQRGDILYVDLGEGNGSEQGGKRPVCVVGNNIGNKYSPVIIVVPITSKGLKRIMPTHLTLSQQMYGTTDVCNILAEQIMTIDKNRVIHKLFSLNELDMIKLNKRIGISLGLEVPQRKPQTQRVG